MLEQFNNGILKEILNDIRNGNPVDPKLSYLAGKYVELYETNEKILFELRASLQIGKISGAQVVIGVINWDFIIGTLGALIGLGFFLLKLFCPSTALWSNIITIISAAISGTGIIHFILRKKGKLEISKSLL